LIVVTGDARVSNWVARKIEGHEIEWGPHTSLAVVHGGRVLAGVVYSEFRNGVDIRVSIASNGPGWASRGVLRALFDYPFNQLGVIRITCLIADDNVKSQTLCEKLGFVPEGIHPRAWDGKKDVISFGLLRETCKWI